MDDDLRQAMHEACDGIADREAFIDDGRGGLWMRLSDCYYRWLKDHNITVAFNGPRKSAA